MNTEKRPTNPQYGSRVRQMAQLLPLLPDHDHYAVIFGGTGAEFLHKGLYSKLESFNDTDGHLYQFFTAYRKDPEGLTQRMLKRPVHQKRSHQDALKILQSPSKSSITNAWAFLTVAFHGTADQHSEPVALIEQVAERFSEVQMFDRPWERLIRKLDTPRTLFLLEPPDLGVGKMSGHDHEEMLKLINEIDGHVVLIGYDIPLYRQKLAHWRKKRLQRSSGQHTRTKAIWLSYDQNGKKRTKQQRKSKPT